MMIQQPTYLWALLGLLVPLVIHLWSRKAGKTIKVGSVQWMIAAENTRLSSIRFNEVGLYLLRSCVVIVAVLILLDLSQQQPKKADNLPSEWLLTEEAMLRHPVARLAVDSLQKQGCAIHLLKPQLPSILPQQLAAIKVSASTNFAKPDKANPIDYWSFLRELNTRPQAPKKVWILAPNTAQHFAGNRPQLSYAVQWLSLPSERPQVFLVDALRLPNDSLWLSIGKSTQQGTLLLKEKVKQERTIQIRDLPLMRVQNQQVSFANAPNNAVTIRQAQTQHIQLLYDNTFALDQQYLATALQAVGEYMGVKVDIKASKTLDTAHKMDWLVVLKKEKLNAQDYSKIKARKLLYRAGSSAAQWITADTSQAHVHWLEQRLDPELNLQALELGLLETLTQLLFANPQAEERLKQFDQRQLSDTQAMPQAMTSQATPEKTLPKPETRSLSAWLWWLLVVGVLSERIVANRTHKKP